jgi:hypothetical protein
MRSAHATRQTDGPPGIPGSTALRAQSVRRALRELPRCENRATNNTNINWDGNMESRGTAVGARHHLGGWHEAEATGQGHDGPPLPFPPCFGDLT